jgi:hypothetical protein
VPIYKIEKWRKKWTWIFRICWKYLPELRSPRHDLFIVTLSPGTGGVKRGIRQVPSPQSPGRFSWIPMSPAVMMMLNGVTP